ncbi:hypothetical protein BJ165DRAFT_1503661 [Panaeolus papilionaceus]|nr:hypothetical protein BJ165DRAFT_1503661 [Panaeolus papilionaceus]
MMAPSLQTSSTTSAMPVPLPSPIEKIAQLLYSSSSGSRKRRRADSDTIDLRENQARVQRRLNNSRNTSPDPIPSPESVLDEETVAAL